MGDDERPSIDDRNAANRARFEQLPVAGSPAYWAKLEDSEKASRLDLEILVMCARERRAARKRGDLVRIYEMLLKKTDVTLKEWVNRLIPQGARDRAGVIEEIMQECALGLWQELDGEDDTFLTQGFWIRMLRMVTNIATQKRIEEGLSKRKGVDKSTRVLQSNSESIDRPIGPDDDRTVGETIADQHAEDGFSLIEFLNDLQDVRRFLTSDERLLLQNEITGELTQAQLGERLNITPRAVRDRLKALHAKLRALLNPPSDGDGGATAGGEEERS